MVAMAVVDDNSFDALAFGIPHPGTLRYIQDQFDQLRNGAAQLYGLSTDFINNAWNAFQDFGSQEAIEKAKAVVYNYDGSTLHNVVYLGTLPQLQLADVHMQRWLMANPEARMLFIKQAIDGYTDSYVDMQPGVLGQEHYDYRRVTDGVYMEVPDSDEMVAVSYFEDLHDEDQDRLDFTEQMQILNTWDIMNRILRETDFDPTNPYGGLR